jgi:hypothetical protein
VAKLTPAQRKGLEILEREGKLAPRDFAREMWPDSPAWNRRTRGSGSANRAGAVGGTMPMNGAKVLWSLNYLACASHENGIWFITERGRQRLTEPS